MANLSPSPKLQFFDNNGAPLIGGKLYSYQAGTTSPLATYTDSTESAMNANPIILDSRGEASVWLGSSIYKLKLQSAVGVDIWTVDYVNNSSVVGTANIANSAVTTAKIADASITNAKLASSVLLSIANGGTNATTATTALTNFGFSNSLSTTGYQLIGTNGLIIQWGQISQTDTGSAVLFNISFPRTFTTAALQGFMTAGNNLSSGIAASVEGLSTTGMSGFTVGSAATRVWRWLAIGY